MGVNTYWVTFISFSTVSAARIRIFFWILNNFIIFCWAAPSITWVILGFGLSSWLWYQFFWTWVMMWNLSSFVYSRVVVLVLWKGSETFCTLFKKKERSHLFFDQIWCYQNWVKRHSSQNSWSRMLWTKLFIPSTMNICLMFWHTKWGLVCCTKMINHGINQWLFSLHFKIFGWKCIVNWLEKFSLII